MTGNSKAKKELKIIYGNKCMLTLLKEKLTYHHLTKAEHGGKSTIENGGLAITEIHQWLHNNIELKDKELFYLINECIDLYKQCILLKNKELIEQYEKEVAPEFVKKINSQQLKRRKQI